MELSERATHATCELGNGLLGRVGGIRIAQPSFAESLLQELCTNHSDALSDALLPAKQETAFGSVGPSKKRAELGY
jgi:hypothetical protein